MSATSSFIVDRAHAPMDNITLYDPTDIRASYSGGLGPFILEEWDRIGGTDEKMVLAKNPRYFNVANEPKVDNLSL